MSFKSLSIVAAAALALCAGAAQAQVSGFANGGFEIAPNGPNEFADAWRGTNGLPATRSVAQAHTGTYSALLGGPTAAFFGAGLVQNSLEDGMLMAIDPANWGTAPTLSFWAFGNTSQTGNINYSLRYLNAAGGILNPVVTTSFFGGNVDRGWTQITNSGTVIPVGTTAVFLEMTFAVGPAGVQPPGNCGVDNSTGAPLPCNFGTAAVYIDDVSLTLANPVAAIPEPETYALMLAGLGIVGSIVRRRRRAA